MDVFSPDYFTARDRFRAVATRRGCALESHPIQAQGPSLEPLTIDVARLGQENADRLVFLSSGLHGIEGFFGSAVQTAWLETGAERNAVAPPPGTAVVLIHALNPWGFAHRRRTDEQNIDLNRNFMLPGEQHAGSPDLYRKLDPILNPSGPPRRLDFFSARAVAALARFGRSALAQAIAGGQHDYPLGLFFGGTRESETARILSTELPRWIGDARQVLHLDFHTGLGPWETYTLLADHPLTDDQRRQSLALGDARLIEPQECAADYYRSRGGLGGWCRAKFADRRYLMLVAEFGTYGPLKVLSALRRENQAHHSCKADDRRFQRAKAMLTDVFCPASPGWREACVAQAAALIQAAIDVTRG